MLLKCVGAISFQVILLMLFFGKMAFPFRNSSNLKILQNSSVFEKMYFYWFNPANAMIAFSAKSFSPQLVSLVEWLFASQLVDLGSFLLSSHIKGSKNDVQ